MYRVRFLPVLATLLLVPAQAAAQSQWEQQVLDQIRRRFGDLEPTEPPRRAEPKRIDSKKIRISASHPPYAGTTGITIAWRTFLSCSAG